MSFLKTRGGYMAIQGKNVDKQLPAGLYETEFTDAGIMATQQKRKPRELMLFEDGLNTQIMNEVRRFLQLRDIYKQRNEFHKRGYLLYGRPGVGKSVISSLLTDEYIANGDLVFSWSNSLPKFMKKLQGRNILILVEEIDDLARSGACGYFLDFLDGLIPLENVVIVGTTNHIDRIPAAMQRPSRFDRVIEMHPPTVSQRAAYIREKALDSDEVTMLKMVADTEGMSLAEIKELILATEVFQHPYEDTLKRLRELSKLPGLNTEEKQSILKALKGSMSRGHTRQNPTPNANLMSVMLSSPVMSASSEGGSQ